MAIGHWYTTVFGMLLLSDTPKSTPKPYQPSHALAPRQAEGSPNETRTCTHASPTAAAAHA